MKRAFLAPLLVITALSIGACSSPTTGTPTATSTTSSTGDNGGATSSNGGGGQTGSGDPLASVSPCSFLTSAQVTQYQLDSPTQDTENGARTCGWQGVQDGSQNGGELDVDIWDNAGLSQIDTTQYTVSNYTLSKHQAKLSQSSKGGDLCSVSIGVSSTSRIDVVGNSGDGALNTSCNIAKQFAPIVEQNLIAIGH